MQVPKVPQSWDRFLTWINHLSQLGLLALALFGYFHTVLPLYSKALLEEQIADRELQLRKLEAIGKDLETSNAELSRINSAAESKLAEANDELTRRQAVIANQETRLAATQETLREAKTTLAGVTHALTEKSQEANEVRGEASQSYEQLRTQALKNLVIRIQGLCGTNAFLLAGRTIYGVQSKPPRPPTSDEVNEIADCVSQLPIGPTADTNVLQEIDRNKIAEAAREATQRLRVALPVEYAAIYEQEKKDNEAIDREYAGYIQQWESSQPAASPQEEIAALRIKILSDQINSIPANQARILGASKRLSEVVTREIRPIADLYGPLPAPSL